MTLRMLDSIYPANLPPGADAYLAYPDGKWPTAAAVKAKFPSKPVLVLSVFARDVSQGYDREPGDLDVTELASAVNRSIAARYWRPVVYASAANMNACISALLLAGISRSSVRLLSAHYGAGKHICGPATCGLVHTYMDGTQWRDNAPGVGGTLVDESVLLDDFFAAPPPAQEAYDMASFTEAQLEAAVAAAVTSQPVRDTLATASLWWLDKALSGTIPPGATPQEEALLVSVRASVVMLATLPAKPAA